MELRWKGVRRLSEFEKFTNCYSVMVRVILDKTGNWLIADICRSPAEDDFCGV